MSRVEVYVSTNPYRCEIEVDGVTFRSDCNTWDDAIRLSMIVVKALGLGRTADQGTVTINGEDVPTIPDPETCNADHA